MRIEYMHVVVGDHASPWNDVAGAEQAVDRLRARNDVAGGIGDGQVRGVGRGLRRDLGGPGLGAIQIDTGPAFGGV